jgi:3-methylfumaryl-CoA hydratase
MTDHTDWIGREAIRTETITQRQVDGLKATLAGTLAPGAVPPGLHWCLVPDLADPQDLGRDGHPRRGMFMPDLPGLPRRMWAGGELSFNAPLQTGDSVTRTSKITDISFKTGSTGSLGFVTVQHLYSVADQTRITERQDIVYREDAKPGTSALPAAAEDWPEAEHWQITPDPVLLFRYSALTFNGHRIHYDQPYATGVEGYAGLVVHGPLQAIWMLNLATSILGHLPAIFHYRGLSPLISGTPVRIEARPSPEGLALRVRRDDGVVTMQATAIDLRNPCEGDVRIRSSPASRAKGTGAPGGPRAIVAPPPATRVLRKSR